MEPRDLLLIPMLLLIVGAPIWLANDVIRALWEEIEGGYRRAFGDLDPGLIPGRPLWRLRHR